MKLLNYYNEYSTYLASLDIDNPKYLTYNRWRSNYKNLKQTLIDFEIILIFHYIFIYIFDDAPQPLFF